MSRIGESIEIESRLVSSRTWVTVEWGVATSRVPGLGEDENVSEPDRGSGCIIL